MAIMGKIIGGAAGFAVGGPLGALIGAVAGHAVDRLRSSAGEDQDSTNQTAFTIAVIALGAKMAKADGQVTPDEIRAFREVFKFSEEDLNDVGRVFNVARQDARGYEPYAKQIAKMFQDRPAILEELLDALFHIAKADNVLHPGEDEFLERVAAIFGFDEAAYRRIREAHVGPATADPYTVLGVSRDASDEEIRRAWRNLIKENHPDKLIAEGLPQDFVDVATAKMAAINAAYEEIQRIRKA